MKLRSIRSCSFALLFDFLSTLNVCASELTKTKRYSGCAVGYHGPDCKTACRYPSFGLYCQDKCNCDELLCNFKSGCQGTTIDNNLNPTSSSTHDISVTYRLNICDEKGEQRYRSDIVASVIGLTTISGVFLVSYIGLHFFILYLKSKHESPKPARLNVLIV
uniref:Uncharacterized protein LOC111102611 isoform X2 n=1 Tax=Crassostrea virginica TaxID=6565 RepID=A0A8B8AHZ1_CRAVI|nr:uncharacterized protein LOC111102611 isoform X2 [Crassostrea virginica]